MKSIAEIDEFKKLFIQLRSVINEFNELSKKKPNDPVNKFKLKLVNELLDPANNIIDERNKPFEDFDKFDEDEMPSNSDVVLILSQYLACLKKFAFEQIVRDGMDYYWTIKGKQSSIQANIRQFQ